jgi:regulator of extracellular matrix RemA (YlzA/DUF370 family)
MTTSISQHQAINLGRLMCQATDEILWQPAADRLNAQGKAKSLLCRVGSGQATYHRYDTRSRAHVINYGQRMILAKYQPETAVGWLSAREIRKKGYFDGEVSPLNLLAHTCCHEFAHLLQQVAGQRHFGSVHNRHFYDTLDRLHHSGAAQDTRAFLQQQASKRGLSLPAQPFTPIHAEAEVLQRHWQVGECVSFGVGQRQRQGIVSRVNRKTCTVKGTGASRGLLYRVPKAMLTAR